MPRKYVRKAKEQILETKKAKLYRLECRLVRLETMVQVKSDQLNPLRLKIAALHREITPKPTETENAE